MAVADEPVVAPAAGAAETSMAAPSMPTTAPPAKRRPPKKGGGGPNPLVVVGMAFVAGVALAKLIDWRGHAFPRR